MRDKASTLHDMIVVTLLMLALALPFLRAASDGAARVRMHFRTEEMAKPRDFTAETSRSVCTVMAAALTYENPDGTFTRVKCED
jgi:hypothetical protein